MAEMSANEKRSYIEDCWEWSVFWEPAPLPNPHEDEMLPWTMQVADAKCLDVHEFTGATEEECVSSAYEFTRKSQEEIRQVKKQIDWIQAASLVYRRHLEASPRNWRVLGKESDLIALSILAREQAALAELQRGMKEASHG
jgi:hypothetical protein